MGSQKKSLSIPEIISALTLDEKISLISGKQSIVINSNSGLEIQQTTQTRLLLERLIGGDDRHTTAIQRGDIDISSLRFSDGVSELSCQQSKKIRRAYYFVVFTFYFR